MTHAAPSQKSFSEYCKVLSLVLCYLIYLVVVYFSLFQMSNIASYVDDDTSELMNALNSLEKDPDILLKWLKKNLLKANREKYHVLLSTDKNNARRLGEFSVTNSKCLKLIGIKIDSQLSFHNQADHLFKKNLKNSCVCLVT